MENKKPSNLTNYILILLLAAAAFLAGMYVKDSGNNGEKAGEQAVVQNQPTNPEAAPEEEAPLSEADWLKISQDGAAEKGSKDAPVTIIEFSEYECPFCQRYVQDAYVKIFAEYGDKIRYVFHDYPLPFHANAQITSEAARCAGDQGKYWEMHDELFEKRDEWTAATDAKVTLANLAAGIGLNKANFSSCLTSGKYTQAVKDDFALGQAVGISGTPSFFVNGQKLVGAQPFEAFKTVIDGELNK
jgi:protein-disulfide isomerase